MKKLNINATVQQNIGLIALFSLCIVGGAMIALTPAKGIWEPIYIIAAILIIMLLATCRKEYISLASAGILTFLYVAIRFVLVSQRGGEIHPSFFIYLFMPFAVAIAMRLFLLGNKRIQLELSIMKEREEELVMISHLSGLYNLKSLYNDLCRMSAYVQRHKLVLCLMIVKMEFEKDVNKMYQKEKFNELLKTTAELLTDAVRVEDKVYAIDDMGNFGIMLICDEENSEFVQNRICKRLDHSLQNASFDKENYGFKIKVSCKEYDVEEYGEDVIRFQRAVMNSIL